MKNKPDEIGEKSDPGKQSQKTSFSVGRSRPKFEMILHDESVT